MKIYQKQKKPVDLTSPTPEQNLWKSVVTQAVRDAFSPDEYHQRRAWTWFFRKSRDYFLVCEFAGISADSLRKTMIETVFFNHIIQKGGLIMKNTKKIQFKIELPEKDPKLQNPTKSIVKKFEIARRAKSIFSAIYSQQELDKAIGSLTLQDIIDVCKQSEDELDAEAAWEAEND
jgi:hypothetical protein